MVADLLHTLWAFALLSLAFVPLERAFAARTVPWLRPGLALDGLYFAGQYLLWNAPVSMAIVGLHRLMQAGPLDGLHAGFTSLPYWLQFVAAIGLSDLAIYWGHRLQHRVPFLWRFHRVHHTAEHLDWLAAHREHPLDNLYTRTIENLPLLLLGLPLAGIAGFAMFRGLWAIFIHANVTLSPGPLRVLFGSPRLHHWHHAVAGGGQMNFANLCPLMDLAFGTWHDPGHMPERVGLPQPCRRGYVGALLAPLLPGRFTGSR